MKRAAFAALVTIALIGCPPAQKQAPDAGSAGCKRVGDSCEFSPGKLGSCVAKNDCAPGEACFVCQSQH